MTQPSNERLITEQRLSDVVGESIQNSAMTKKGQCLGDLFLGNKTNRAQSDGVKVSLTNGFQVDGLNSSGAQLFKANELYDVAECNWTDDTLALWGAAYENKLKSNGVAAPFDVTTMVEGSYLVFTFLKFAGTYQHIRIWIDDVPITQWYLGTRASGTLNRDMPEIPCVEDDVVYFANINFPTRGLYKVRIAGPLMTAADSFIQLNADGKLHKPSKQRVFGVISDSWYDNISAANTSLTPAMEIAGQTGWKQWNLAVGGSGFINPSGYLNGPHNFSSDAVFSALEKAPPLDLLILNGTVNDMSYGDALVTSGMQIFFERWRSVRPDTPIVWQGLEPQSYFESVFGSQAIINREKLLNDVALADPSVIGTILPAKENWYTGTGSIVSPNGTGNQDFVIGGDQIHLSAFGCRLTGRLVAERLAPIPTWKGT